MGGGGVKKGRIRGPFDKSVTCHGLGRAVGPSSRSSLSMTPTSMQVSDMAATEQPAPAPPPSPATAAARREEDVGRGKRVCEPFVYVNSRG